jgi:predicted nucleic acid-binding protein
MIAVDTSVVVAAFASWHEGHASAAAALARRPRVPAHVLLETGIVRGSIHDALVGATVRHAGARLLSRDRRAAPTYERVGVEYALIG